MTDDERKAIVEKAIHRAIANGWREQEFRSDKRYTWPPKEVHLVEDRDYYSSPGWWLESNDIRFLSAQVCQSDYYEDIIYDHDFAKALWGESPEPTLLYVWEAPGQYQPYTLPAWEYHLQQMVIAEDAIAYLGENI